MKKNIEMESAIEGMGAYMEEMEKKMGRMEVELEISRRVAARTTMENESLRERNEEMEKKGKGVQGWLKIVIGVMKWRDL